MVENEPEYEIAEETPIKKEKKVKSSCTCNSSTGRDVYCAIDGDSDKI
jgi:hypothetical protein